MKSKDLLSATYSTTIAARACGTKPKNVTNYTPKYIRPDVEAEGSGTGHEFNGYTIIRMSLFFRLAPHALKVRQAAGVCWPQEKENERELAAAISLAVERYSQAKAANTLLENALTPIQYVLYPGKKDWEGDIVDSSDRAATALYRDKPLAITVSISHAVKLIIENLSRLTGNA